MDVQLQELPSVVVTLTNEEACTLLEVLKIAQQYNSDCGEVCEFTANLHRLVYVLLT